MLPLEFEVQFDILYNNISSNQAPGLNAYEKSVFLTKAQDEIIKNYFDPAGNKYQKGFDDSSKRQIDFSMLMKTIVPNNVNSEELLFLNDNTVCYAMPEDIMFYINEFLDVRRNDEILRLTVSPISYSEYYGITLKPFKRPLKNQAWRLISSGKGSGYTYVDYGNIAKILKPYSKYDYTTLFNTLYMKSLNLDTLTEGDVYLQIENKYLGIEDILVDTKDLALVLDPAIISSISECLNKQVEATNTIVQLIPGYEDTIVKYLVRYVKKPRPIILADLDDGLTIKGESMQLACELDSSLHEEILQRAVELAKIAWVSTGAEGTQLFIEAGKNSE